MNKRKLTGFLLILSLWISSMSYAGGAGSKACKGPNPPPNCGGGGQSGAN